MNALNEICFFEEKIYDLIKASQEHEGRAVRARMDIKKFQTILEVAAKDRKFHENNILHVKVTDSELPVNIKEFAEAKRNLQKAQIRYENAKVGILQAEAVIARCQEATDANARYIAEIRISLCKYGQILDFPSKGSVNEND